MINKNYNRPFIVTMLILLLLIGLAMIRVYEGKTGMFKQINAKLASSLIEKKKDSEGTKCFLIGTQSGWKPPHYKITTDSMYVDSMFHAYLPESSSPWDALQRDNFIMFKPNSNSGFYTECGTYTETKKGKKKFSGDSKRRYVVKRFR